MNADQLTYMCNKMQTIGAFEAKTHFSEIASKIHKGHEMTTVKLDLTQKGYKLLHNILVWAELYDKDHNEGKNQKIL